MPLTIFQAQVTDEAGNVIDTPQITVKREVTGLPLATGLKADKAGLTNKGNPFDGDSDGYFSFYAPDGVYRIIATKGAFTRTWYDVPLGSIHAGLFHAAGTFAQRSTYAAEPSPRADGTLFVYLSIDGDGSSPATGIPVLYAKTSDADTWSSPIPFLGGGIYEIFNFDSDQPPDGEEILSILFTREVRFPADFVGSISKARAAATGTAIYSIQKNDLEVGTITFNASADGVFAMASDVTFDFGDRMSIISPNPTDPGLTVVTTTLVGYR